MAKPPNGTVIDTGHALYSALVGCWAFLEGSGATSADASTGGRTLTLGTATWTTDGGDACLTRGSVSAGSALSSTLALPGTQDWSIAWKASIATGTSSGVVCGVQGSTASFVWMRDDTNYVRFRDVASNTADITYSGFEVLHNYVLTYDNAAQQLEFYVDGVSVGTAAFTLTADINIARLMPEFAGIGFVGNLHYVYVWDNRKLSLAEAGDLNTDPYDMFGADAVTLTCPRLVQRGASSGPLAVSGTYSGVTADAVQVKILLAADNSTIVDWADVDASLAGGTWAGSVTVPTGGPYYAQARTHDSGDSVLASSTDSATFIVGDIFVVIGQSNADGRALNLQTYGGSSVCWLQRQSGAIDEILNDPWSDSVQADGSWGPLLATLISADQGASVPLAFIVSTAGGTQLYGSVWEPPSGTQWVAVDDMIDSLDLNGILAVLWLQGESDAISGVTESQYEGAEQTLATAVNGWPGTPPLISTLVGEVNGSTDAQTDAIRAAKIANWDSGATLPGVNPVDINLSNDGLHYYTDAEISELAGRWWVALDAAVYGGTIPRGPRLVSLTYVGDKIDATFDTDLEADASYTTNQWGVVDNGVAATVSTVTRTGTRVVQIDCSATLIGPVTVTHASGAVGAAAVHPRTAAINLPATINSISSVKIPAEPFFAYSASEPGGGGDSSGSGLMLLGVG